MKYYNNPKFSKREHELDESLVKKIMTKGTHERTEAICAIAMVVIAVLFIFAYGFIITVFGPSALVINKP